MKDIAKNNFIGEFMMDKNLCDEMIELHNSFSLISEEESKKHTFWISKIDTEDSTYGPPGKSSVDLAIHPVCFVNPNNIPFENRPHIKVALKYWTELQMCMNEYKEQLIGDSVPGPCEVKSFLEPIFHHTMINDTMLIQHYKPGQGFKPWHSERSWMTMNRQFVYMTYLNDVPDGGTDFYFQELTVKAEKGKTLIWPADYTHIHRSQISNTSEKYIATGWFSYDKNSEMLPENGLEKSQR